MGSRLKSYLNGHDLTAHFYMHVHVLSVVVHLFSCDWRQHAPGSVHLHFSLAYTKNTHIDIFPILKV